MNCSEDSDFCSVLLFKATKHSTTGIKKGQVIFASECYSTKMCPCCLEINDKVGKSRVFQCPREGCKWRTGRDENAAFNILMFYLKKNVLEFKANQNHAAQESTTGLATTA